MGTSWNGYAKGSREYTRMLVAMFCAGVATFAQLYSPQALLPSIARDFKVDPASSALTISATTLGMAIFAIIWTYIADRAGKSRAMFIAVILATVFGLVAPWSTSFPLLLVLRFTEGAMLAGIASVAVAFIAEESRAVDAGAAAGLYISGTSIGGLLGRLTAAPISEWSGSWRVGMLSVSLMATLAAVLFMVLLPKARRFTPVPRQGAIAETCHRIAENVKNPVLLALYTLAFMFMGTFVTIFNYVGFKLEAAPFELSETAVSLVFLTYLTGTVASSRAARLVSQRGEVFVLSLSLVFMGAGVLLTISDSLFLVIAGLALITLGFFSGHSVAAAQVGVRARAGKAQATALYNMAYYAGGALVGWVGGYFFAAGGWGFAGVFCIVLMLVLGAVSLLVIKRNAAKS